MEFFASYEHVQQIEQSFLAAREDDAVTLLAELSWYLRQTDTPRALQLAEQVTASLHAKPTLVASQQALLWRMQLVRAEAKWLYADFVEAGKLAQAALAGFAALADVDGQADAHWLLSWIALDQNDGSQRDSALLAMQDVSREHDQTRHALAHAMHVIWRVFFDVDAALTSWMANSEEIRSQKAPACYCWIAAMFGFAAKQCSEHVQAIRHFHQAFNLALACGQVRCAIIVAASIRDSFSALNEHQSALEWIQRGLQLARNSGWSGSIGIALYQTADTLRSLQRMSEARSLLQEAMTILTPTLASQSYAVSLLHLGNIQFDSTEFADSLATFRLLESRAKALARVDLQFSALRGQALALAQLGLAQDALQAAHAALSTASSRADNQIIALRLIADLHANFSLHCDEKQAGEQPALYYLQRALALAASIDGYAVPGDLYDMLASEQAKAGDFALAYASSAQASVAHKTNFSQQAKMRADALLLSHTSERERSELEHHQQLAEMETKRAQILQQTNHTLDLLGKIGQEVTACLHLEPIFEVLNRHVQYLLEVNSFAIFLLEKDAAHITLKFGVEDGAALPQVRFAMDQLDNLAVRCLVEQREILMDAVADSDVDDGGRSPMIADTRLNLSGLFAPLSLGDEVIGVMTIQSAHAHMYGERELMIFRSLCAYAAIALANARTHSQLQETQQQMLLQEKMAGLGTLTAGVAHEINNPTNFAHVAAQVLQRDLREFEEFLAELVQDDDAQEVVALFRQRFATLQEHAATVLNGTERIKGIVRDLRSFTRLDEAEKKAIHLSECIQSTVNLVRTSWLEQVEFIIEIEADPLIECWPALLNQVLMNLLVNGCQAIAEKRLRSASAERGELHLHLSQHENHALLTVRDNGIGIELATQARVMEPFFTTKAVGSGTGMGLAIAFGIVVKHGGSLRFSSEPGVGTCFTVQLPLPTNHAA